MRIRDPLNHSRQNTSFVAIAVAAFFAIALYTTNGCGGTSSSPTTPNDSSYLQGTVLTASGTPITNAAVKLTQGSHVASTTTAPDGSYSFSAFVPGDVRLDVTAAGYAPFTVTVTLGPGANTYYVRLQPAG